MRRSHLSRKHQGSDGHIPAPVVDPRDAPKQPIDAETCASSGLPKNIFAPSGQQELGARAQTAIWSAAMTAVDCIAIGLAICDSTGAVQFLNRTADRIVRERDVLRVTDHGQLDTVSGDAPSLNSLFESVSQFADTNKGELRALVTAIPRSSGQRPLTLIVRLAEGLTPSAETVHVLVLMLEGNRVVETHESDLYHLFAFTPAETRFANQLMSGKTIADACAALKVTHSTGCSHLRNMFKKTRVHRQGELVALLLRSIGMLRFRASKPLLRGALSVADALSGQNQAKLTALIQRDVDSIL